MNSAKKLGKILGVEDAMLRKIDEHMSGVFGIKGVLEMVSEKNEKRIASVLHKINSGKQEVSHVRSALRSTILSHEKQFLALLEKFPGDDEFERASHLVVNIASAGKGFFLKKKKAEEILKKCPPKALLSFLEYENIDELLKNEEIDEVLSALRFTESRKWMHETFDAAYSDLTPKDFEERNIELRVLGPKWMDIGKKFAEKKHHNVSHLKEFGIIFLNPIKMDVPGKFMRDFALLLHYFHEIEFYSKLFKKYTKEKNFAERLKSLLRGDILEAKNLNEGEWLIIQRYLWKDNPKDQRLFIPRINPESIYWARGERDFARFALEYDDFDAELWHDLDWVGNFFKREKQGGEELVSFDLEDNVMSFVSFMEGKEEFFTYHQREAMWTKIFSEYIGGEGEMEKLILENFEKGKISF